MAFFRGGLVLERRLMSFGLHDGCFKKDSQIYTKEWAKVESSLARTGPGGF